MTRSAERSTGEIGAPVGVPRTRACPDCGQAFDDASALVDHALTHHVTAETPAAHIRRPRGSRGLRRVLTGLALLPVLALWALVIVGLVTEPVSAPEAPDSVVHTIAADLMRSGDADRFRPVEPEAGWDVAYELEADGVIGDFGLITIRDEALAARRCATKPPPTIWARRS